MSNVGLFFQGYYLEFGFELLINLEMNVTIFHGVNLLLLYTFIYG